MIYNIVRRARVDDRHLPSDLSPVLRQIYASRGCSSADYQLALVNLIHPDTMKDIDKAASIVADAIAAQQTIFIIGDFDADGASSTSLCMLALKMMGAKRVDYLIPNRFDYGYGLSPKIVDVARKKGAELIITVDNGISSIAGVDAAKAAGIKVIITDHHLPGEVLPSADAIVNPNQQGCQFASKGIAGVGVAFYLMLALRAKLRGDNWYQAQNIIEPNLASLVDIVALGTVADVVPLDTNNRILVAAGLKRVRAGRCRPGIRALLEAANRNAANAVAGDFGFAVAPRLNAAGRIDEMSLGVEILLCEDLATARRMATKLDSLNGERRRLETKMREDALNCLAELSIDDSQLPWGIAMYQPDWHQGVIGIVAARIKEQYHRPVIAFAKANNGEIKGSARSINGLHMRDILALIDGRYPQLIISFGGHAMAAGLTIKADDFEHFKSIYDQTIRERLTPEYLKGEILTDGQLEPQQLTMKLARELRMAGPWGQGFSEPIFDGYFKIIKQRVVGQRHLKLILATLDGQTEVDAIAFNADIDTWVNNSIDYAQVAYKLDINQFKGKESLQLLVTQLVPCSCPPMAVGLDTTG